MHYLLYSIQFNFYYNEDTDQFELLPIPTMMRIFVLNRDFQASTWFHTLYNGMVLRVFEANELCVWYNRPSLHSTVATTFCWKFIRWPMVECKYCLIMRPLNHIFVKLLLTRRFVLGYGRHAFHHFSYSEFCFFWFKRSQIFLLNLQSNSIFEYNQFILGE